MGIPSQTYKKAFAELRPKFIPEEYRIVDRRLKSDVYGFAATGTFLWGEFIN
jgi:hypothetical protein